jgi:hypothetical protein
MTTLCPLTIITTTTTTDPYCGFPNGRTWSLFESLLAEAVGTPAEEAKQKARKVVGSVSNRGEAIDKNEEVAQRRRGKAQIKRADSQYKERL